MKWEASGKILIVQDVQQVSNSLAHTNARATCVILYFTDFCRLSGMEGFNCISEELCIPRDYVCDGIPDCIQGSVVFDEMNCPPPPPGNSVKSQYFRDANQTTLGM